MSNILVIAEKPDVAADISSAMIPDAKSQKGYYSGQVSGDVWVVTSAFGHLLTLCDPEDYDAKYKTWKMSDLPIYFPDWKLKEPQEKYKSERLDLIRKLIAKADLVISAGDPDDEGQLLIDEIIDHLDYKGPVKRVLINDSMPENIRREFSGMKENDDFRSLGKAANARRMADYCFGVNETRLAGIKLHKQGLAVGRVQTPTLGLVIARDMLIENHVSSKYYEMDLDVLTSEFPYPAVFKFKPGKKYLKDNDTDKVLDMALLSGIGDEIKGKDISFNTTVKNKTTNPPLPYNLTQLQADMNRRYGFSMNKTLDITQSLRSRHAITYNRSDSQYLKEEHFREAADLFSVILNGSLKSEYDLDFTRHSACFNDSLVTAHHGIIPQKNNIDPDRLTSDERKVYLAIVQRYAMQFMQPLIQKVSSSTFKYSYEEYEHSFEHTAYETVSPGYTEYFGRDKENDKEDHEEGKAFFLPGQHQGKADECRINEKETKPPARYTDGTLASDMASIAKYVTDPQIRDILKKKDEGKKGENGSIGTVATRGVIVDNLVKRGFLERKGKNIISTQLGREFFSILPESITKADTTARWWLIQEDIKDGRETDVNAIQRSVIDVFMQHKDSAYEGKSIKLYEEKPKTQGEWNGKIVQINNVWGDHTFTEEELDELLKGNKITFTYKGRSITGSLAEQSYKGRKFIGFKPDSPEKQEGYIYGSFKGNDIKFKQTWAGHTFSEQESKDLLDGKEITIMAKKKNGDDWEVKGSLARQTFKGVKFYGFKPVLERKKKK